MPKRLWQTKKWAEMILVVVIVEKNTRSGAAHLIKEEFIWQKVRKTFGLNYIKQLQLFEMQTLGKS